MGIIGGKQQGWFHQILSLAVMSSMRLMGFRANACRCGSMVISGVSLSRQSYTFCRVFIFMKAHSLHAHMASSGGAGINVLSGHSRFISCKIPDSVATIKVLQSERLAYLMGEEVVPMKSAMV